MRKVISKLAWVTGVCLSLLGFNLLRAEASPKSPIYSAVALPNSLNPSAPLLFHGLLYFVAETPLGVRKVHVYDGITVRVAFETRSHHDQDDDPGELTLLGESLAFSALQLDRVRKLYVFNGLSLTTRPVNPAGVDDLTHGLVALNGALYFAALARSHSLKLFRFDGTAVSQVADTRGDPTLSDDPEVPLLFQGQIYFSSHVANGASKLFRYDGSRAVQVADLRQDPELDDDPAGFFVHENFMLFSAKIADHAYKLFSWDGIKVRRLSNTRADLGLNDDPWDFTEFQGQVLFTSMVGDSSLGRKRVYKFFQTDGLKVTSLPIALSSPASFNNDPTDLLVRGLTVYFSSLNPYEPGSIQLFNGNQVVRVPMERNYVSLNTIKPKILGFIDGNLAFFASDSSGNTRLFLYSSGRTTRGLNLFPEDSDFGSTTPTWAVYNGLIIIKGLVGPGLDGEIYYTIKPSSGAGQ